MATKLTGLQKTGCTLTAAIALILGTTFVNEGGYVNDPKDPGGETNHGITKTVAVANGYTAPMKDMPKSVAEEIYKKNYITKPNYTSFIQMSVAVGHKLHDQGVNTGVGTASKFIQRSLNALNYQSMLGKDLVVDGKVGNATLQAYQKLINKRGQLVACQTILKMLDALQGARYIELAENTKNNYAMRKYSQGWIANRIGNVPDSECHPTTD